mmetsp:Transcript_16335/g.23958  ORF Transcript_16335/g.23958 Transcript_16335/m.23958 type:complete len:154 (+) Transcript_16335:266-727(+)
MRVQVRVENESQEKARDEDEEDRKIAVREQMAAKEGVAAACTACGLGVEKVHSGHYQHQRDGFDQSVQPVSRSIIRKVSFERNNGNQSRREGKQVEIQSLHGESLGSSFLSDLDQKNQESEHAHDGAQRQQERKVTVAEDVIDDQGRHYEKEP